MKQPAAITKILNKLQKEKGYPDEELSVQTGAMEILKTASSRCAELWTE